MPKEADILKACKARLEFWQLRKIVVFFDRINSGKIFLNGRWIQMAKEGSPDLIAYIKHKDICAIYFIECKREKAKLRDSQIEFMMKFRDLSNVFYDVVTNPDQVNYRIESITNFQIDQLDKVNI